VDTERGGSRLCPIINVRGSLSSKEGWVACGSYSGVTIAKDAAIDSSGWMNYYNYSGDQMMSVPQPLGRLSNKRKSDCWPGSSQISASWHSQRSASIIWRDT